jgi:HPt (histidine-containing phosphotransfer) domain-containing protein
MSARGTESDREACQAAGMTACLPKPVDIEELFKAIESIKGHRPDVLDFRKTENGRTSATENVVLDREGAMRRLQGDEVIFTMFVKQFSTQAGPLFSEIEHAAGRGVMKDVVQPAHQLRGIAANLGAMQVQSLAAEIERAGKAEEPSQTSDLVRRLSTAIVDVSRLLEPFA